MPVIDTYSPAQRAQVRATLVALDGQLALQQKALEQQLAAYGARRGQIANALSHLDTLEKPSAAKGPKGAKTAAGGLRPKKRPGGRRPRP